LRRQGSGGGEAVASAGLIQRHYAFRAGSSPQRAEALLRPIAGSRGRMILMTWNRHLPLALMLAMLAGIVVGILI
jgi:hypothetical protein